jgi:hypothetical protein
VTPSDLAAPDPAARRGFWDWLLRNRRTGEITVAQLPNAPLLVWLAASVLQVWWNPRIADRDVLAVVSSGALAVWALFEIASGVNPFRRMLGTVVLGWIAWSLVR